MACLRELVNDIERMGFLVNIFLLCFCVASDWSDKPGVSIF